VGRRAQQREFEEPTKPNKQPKMRLKEQKRKNSQSKKSLQCSKVLMTILLDKEISMSSKRS
jgi:hypothetical protein